MSSSTGQSYQPPPGPALWCTSGVRRGCAAALVLALAACGVSEPAAPPPGLAATVEQSRDNENRGLLQLVVRNDGDEPVRVRRVELRSDGWERVPPSTYDQEVGPGTRTAFPAGYGAVDCGARAAGSEVLVGLQDGGRVREVRLPVPASDPVLPRLHERACALEAVRAAVDVEITGDWRRSGDEVTGELRLTRRAGDEPVRVTDVQSSIILLLQAPGLPLALEGDASATAVVVRAVRCDPHALIESKRTFTFPVFVALGDDAPLQLSVTADAAGQAVMQEALRERCAAQGIDLS